MRQHVIFINGAPRAGKDTVSQIICDNWEATRLGFADHLKNATHATYGLDVPTHYFENCKDEQSDLFFGLTPRQAYIAHSENYMKPLLGNDIFGQLWLRAAAKIKTPFIVIPDSGFTTEALPIIDKYGVENCTLIRVVREGCTFINDSRSHIILPWVEAIEVRNDSTIGDLRYEILEIGKEW